MNDNRMLSTWRMDQLRVMAWVGPLILVSSVSAQCDPPLPPPPPPDDFPVLLSYTLNGQTVQADPSGSFLISNVSAPDSAPADFIGDDYLFLTAVKITSQQTAYAFGRIPFKIAPGETFVFETGKQAFSAFTTTPPVLPESIALTTLAIPTITPLGSNGQCPNTVPCSVSLQTMATLSDGSPPVPVTLHCQWTTYRTSNENIARVIPDQPCSTQTPCDPSDPCRQTGMLVEGVSPGVAFITATNGGATSVIKITVANPDDLISTTVEGFVRRPDASVVSGADVIVKMDGGTSVSQSVTTDAAGFFSISPVTLPDTTPTIFAQADVVASITESGSSPLVRPIEDGITDAGIITIDIVCDTPWSAAFGPTTFDAIVLALAVFDDDGDGPNPAALFAGGGFTTAGGTPANGIAKWDGTRWLPLGSGVVPGPRGDAVHALAVIDLDGEGGDPPALYVGGHFVTAGGVVATNIAKWDGTNWSALEGGVGETLFGGGVGETVFGVALAMAAYDDGTGNGTELYVGGSFAVAGGLDDNGMCLSENGCVDTYSVAKWNPTTGWSAVGTGAQPGINTGPVNALAVFDYDGPGLAPPLLYAGGNFFSSSTVPTTSIVKWDGISWTGVGSVGLPGLPSGDNRVEALLVFDDGSGAGPALYAGGLFQDPGDTFENIARWDGNTWTPLGNSIDATASDSVLALAGLFDGSNPPLLYASGSVRRFGGDGGPIDVKFVAQWSGSTWSGSQTWDGKGWSELGTGIESRGTALTVFDDGFGPALYVGGEVADNIDCAGSGGDILVNIEAYVAKWDDPEWSVLGNGLNDEVRSLIVHDDGSGSALFAGGMFIPPKGPCDSNESRFPSNAVARFDGTQWSSLGAGMDCTGFGCVASVHALAVFDADGAGLNPSRLFAGGNFAFAGGISANNVARWDGNNWSAVGTVGGIVEALAVFDDDGTGPNPSSLYAGGVFSGGIKMWDGTTWTTVGGGVTGSVFTEAVFNGELYIGGNFSDAGGVGGAGFLARWDGTSWSAVGSSVNGSVYALTVFDAGIGPALYVGGEFTIAGGLPANRVARWDGSMWSAVAIGLNVNRVGTLVGFDSGQGPFLYAGGDFTTAPAPGGGTIPLNRLAKWNPILDEWSAVGVSSQPGSDPGGGVDGTGTVAVQALAVFDDGLTGPALFAGGVFETASGVPSSNLAKLGCR